MLFLGTATGDSPGYLLTFYQALAGVDCEPSHLALFDRVVDDIDALVRAQDVVIVGGGNTANMLAIWRLHGVEDALRNAYAAGIAPGIALEDSVAARYDDERLIEVVSARVEGRAFHVHANGERALVVRTLT